MKQFIRAVVAVAALAAALPAPAVEVTILGLSFPNATNTFSVLNVFPGINANFTSSPGNFEQKTIDPNGAGPPPPVTGVGVSGKTGGEIDIGESITGTFSAAVKVPRIDLVFLFDGPEFNDVQEQAKITASLLGGGVLTGILTANYTNAAGLTATWAETGGSGTVSNNSPATASGAAWWEIQNPFGNADILSLKFEALAGVSSNTCGEHHNAVCTNQSDYSIERLVLAVPEPGAYALLIAGLLTLGFGMRRRVRV